MTSVLRYAGINRDGANRFHTPKLIFCAAKTKRTGRMPGPMRMGEVLQVMAAGLFGMPAWPCCRDRKLSEPVQDLVGPEPLEPVQRLVQGRELLVGDATDLLHGLDVFLIERIDDAADFLALRGQTNADRAAIDARALMVEEAEFDELLQ